MPVVPSLVLISCRQSQTSCPSQCPQAISRPEAKYQCQGSKELRFGIIAFKLSRLRRAGTPAPNLPSAHRQQRHQHPRGPSSTQAHTAAAPCSDTSTQARSAHMQHAALPILEVRTPIVLAIWGKKHKYLYVLFLCTLWNHAMYSYSTQKHHLKLVAAFRGCMVSSTSVCVQSCCNAFLHLS